MVGSNITYSEPELIFPNDKSVVRPNFDTLYTEAARNDRGQIAMSPGLVGFEPTHLSSHERGP